MIKEWLDLPFPVMWHLYRISGDRIYCKYRCRFAGERKKCTPRSRPETVSLDGVVEAISGITQAGENVAFFVEPTF
jgi:hypothetical protein